LRRFVEEKDNENKDLMTKLMLEFEEAKKKEEEIAMLKRKLHDMQNSASGGDMALDQLRQEKQELEKKLIDVIQTA
jgi:hypothetical protein